MSELHGRRRLSSAVSRITEDNLISVLREVMPYHSANAMEIDYLWHYYKGEQPILERVKEIRPEINNKIVENHAQEIVDFFSGYFLGEPIAYIRRGSKDDSAEIGILNEYMISQSKATQDKELSLWMYIGGVGYRMCLPDTDIVEMDILDPRDTFVVYSTEFGRKPLMACTIRIVEGNRVLLAGYTPEYYFEILSNSTALPIQSDHAYSQYAALSGARITRFERHSMGKIPIIEYDANLAMMGAFEPVIDALNAVNTVTSNRVDGIEQFIQSLMVLYNADIDEEQAARMREFGLVKLKSTDTLKADLKILSEQLDQTQTQTLKDDMLQEIKSIVGMPSSAKGLGGGSSGNVGSVIMWQGWEVCEARVKDTEKLFERSEREFLRLLLSFLRTKRIADISEASVDIKFTRRQYDSIITKVQALQGLLQAGIAPEIAIATCGIFNDPVDVTDRSAEYLRKWEVRDSVDPGNEGDVGETVGGG